MSAERVEFCGSRQVGEVMRYQAVTECGRSCGHLHSSFDEAESCGSGLYYMHKARKSVEASEWLGCRIQNEEGEAMYDEGMTLREHKRSLGIQEAEGK